MRQFFKKNILFFIILLFFTTKQYSQIRYLNNYSFNTERNIAFPRNLLQDSNGNIIIAFNQTIYKFNGYTFTKRYNTHHFIRSIEIKNDTLFIIFSKKKYIYLLDKKNKLDSIYLNIKNLSYLNKIVYFNNNFYISYISEPNKKFYLCKFDPKFKKSKIIFYSKTLFKPKYSFQDKTLYFFNHPNTIISIKDSIKIIKITNKDYLSIFNKKRYRVKDYYIMNNKLFFSIIKKGIYIYDLQKNKIILYNKNIIKSNIVNGDKNSVIYFLSYSSDNYFYFKNKLFNIKNLFYNFPMHPNNLFVDKQNIKWIYDFNKNLYQLNTPLIFNIKFPVKDSSSFKYLSYKKINKKIYISYNNNFFVLDTNFNYKIIRKFNNPIINILKYNKTDLILIKTKINQKKSKKIFNLIFFNSKKRKFYKEIKLKFYTKDDIKFYNNTNDILYLYNNSLYKLNIDKPNTQLKIIDNIKKICNKNNNIIIKTNNNKIYVLNNNKKLKIIDIDCEFLYYINEDSIIFVEGNTIFLQSKDETKILTKFNNIGKYYNINIVNNKIWLFSPLFILVYDLTKKFSYYISKDDGLYGVIKKNNNAPIDFNNHILFITSRSINIISKKNMMYELYKISKNLKIILENFTINNKKIHISDSIKVNNKRNISFRCNYNDYIKENITTISYKIIPLMKDWEKANLNEKIKINNLPYGKNTLLIKLNSLDQNQKTKKIIIFIQKPFYKENLFFAFITFIISLIFVFFSLNDYKYQQEILKIKSETIEYLEREVENKTKQLKEYSNKLEKIINKTSYSLVEKEIEYENLLNKAKEIIFRVDLNGNIITKNKIANDIFPKIKKVSQLLDKKSIIKILKKLRKDREIKEYKLKIQYNNKNLYFILNLFKNKARYNVYDGLLINITEIINYQEALQKSQKLESIGILAGGIAHEFNNINTIIKGYTEILLKNKDTSSIEYKYLNNIHKASISLLNITSKILAYARKQHKISNKIKPYPIIIDIIEFIKSVKKENIKYIINISKDFNNYYIYADPSHIQQIFMNLIINAIDALKNKSTNKQIIIDFSIIEIKKIIKTFDDFIKKGKYVKISVKDNGHGIKKKYLDKIFELFFTTKPVGIGTGLGLSLVYGLIKQNSGYIDVKSKENEGAEFITYFKITK